MPEAPAGNPLEVFKPLTGKTGDFEKEKVIELQKEDKDFKDIIVAPGKQKEDDEQGVLVAPPERSSRA